MKNTLESLYISLTLVQKKKTTKKKKKNRQTNKQTNKKQYELTE